MLLGNQRDLDLSCELASLTQPAVVVHGRDDRARTPERCRELAESLLNAEFWLVDAGHTPVRETLEAVAPPSLTCSREHVAKVLAASLLYSLDELNRRACG